jgi:hypothetical protein
MASSAKNGNFEIPLYFLKAEQGYTIRNMEKINKYSIYW